MNVFLCLLEIYDRSIKVFFASQIASTILLPQWLASCHNNYLSLLSSLKLDKDESEISRFQTVARLSLLAMFGYLSINYFHIEFTVR